MKICLDIRTNTAGGTSTFVDSFVRNLDHQTHHHEIQFVVSKNGQTSVFPVATAPGHSRLGEFRWSQAQLRQLLRNGDFDVYHSLKHVGPIGAKMPCVYRVPAVGQFLGNYPLSIKEQVYWKYIAGYAYKRADLLIAVSNYVAAGLIETLGISPSRIVTIYNGVDPSFRQLEGCDINRLLLAAKGVPNNFILCVGNLVPVKNFHTAIQAYSLLNKAVGVSPALVIAGAADHPHSQKLRQLVSQLGLTNQIHFIGYVTPEELLHLYNAATVLLHTSTHEGFSFTILEAMACGLPIVASDTTSIPEAAGHAAMYCKDPTNAEEVAEVLGHVLDSPSLRNSMRHGGLERVHRFTWQKCVTQTIAAYERLAI